MVLSTVCRTLQKLKVTVTSTFLTKNNAQMAQDNPVKLDSPVQLEMAQDNPVRLDNPVQLEMAQVNPVKLDNLVKLEMAHSMHKLR